MIKKGEKKKKGVKTKDGVKKKNRKLLEMI